MIRLVMYFISKARESLFRAPMPAAATIGMLAVVFLLFNGFALIAHNVATQAERWIGSVRMTVFLADSTTPDDVQQLAGLYRERPEVTGALYIDQQEAKARFLSDYPGDAEIFNGLPSNPLPASIEFELDPTKIDFDILEKLKDDLDKEPFVDEAFYGQELFSKLSTLVGLLRLIGILLGLALIVAVLFLTANTIRLNLYSRKNEIEILQLVGATRWFVRWPYLIEGLIQGILGSILSLILTAIMYYASVGPLASVLSGPYGAMSLHFLPVSTILIVILAGAVLGFFGSFLALGRFWRVI